MAVPVMVRDEEDFEDIISYLRDYIAICKEKDRQLLCFSVLMEFENIKDTNSFEDERNKQLNSPQCHRGFVGFSGSHRRPLGGRSIECEVKVESICFSLCIEPWIRYW